MKKLTFNDLNLDKSLLEAIDDCGYLSCTQTQEKTIPSLLQGGDYLIQASTGTGKTATFCIPLIQHLDPLDLPASVLILAPTRELAYQIQDEFNRLGTYKKIHCVCLVGKESIQSQILQLKQRAHVVVGTPGRTLDLALQGHLDLSCIKTLVLDEATELISLGLLQQTQELVSKMSVNQTWLFSATLESVDSFDFLQLNHFRRIEETQTHQVHDQVQSYFLETDMLDQGLQQILTSVSIESAFIFTNTQEEANHVFRQLKDKKYRVSLLHGGLEQKKRIHALHEFKTGRTRLLISTNVAARGIDIDDVSCVIHYQCPLTYDSYIHRSGRVGRRHMHGISIVLSDASDLSSVKEIIQEETTPFSFPKKIINNHFQQSIKKEDKHYRFKEKNSTLFIRVGKKDKVRTKDIVGALCSVEGIVAENIGIINIQPSFTIVTLLNTSFSSLSVFDDFSIKGKKRKVELKRLK